MLGLENLAMLPRYFDCASTTKTTSQARIKPEIFVNFRPEPDPKSPARLTTLPQLSQNEHLLSLKIREFSYSFFPMHS